MITNTGNLMLGRQLSRWYPNTALLYIEFCAEQFCSIPAVTIETKLKKMQVPSNYDPVSRTYSGVWDDTFKQTWTDNAVWMTSDITTADRFGLGTRWRVDKCELYGIFAIPAQAPPPVTRSSEKVLVWRSLR